MSEPILVIWDYNNQIFTKLYLHNNLPESLSLNGRKPNRVIIPESIYDDTYNDIKPLTAYKAMIVKAKGR